jgi:hypothetical protein
MIYTKKPNDSRLVRDDDPAELRNRRSEFEWRRLFGEDDDTTKYRKAIAGYAAWKIRKGRPTVERTRTTTIRIWSSSGGMNDWTNEQETPTVWYSMIRTNQSNEMLIDGERAGGFVPVIDLMTRKVCESPGVLATMPIDAMGVHLNRCGWRSQWKQRRLAGVDLIEDRTSRVRTVMTFEPATTQ